MHQSSYHMLSWCYQYHLDTKKPIKDPKAQNKLDIVNELMAVLKTDSPWSYETRIEHFKAALTSDKKRILTERRDSSAGAYFLESLLNILSLGIYSKISKGSFCFWKSHGGVFHESLLEITEGKAYTQETSGTEPPSEIPH